MDKAMWLLLSEEERVQHLSLLLNMIENPEMENEAKEKIFEIFDWTIHND